MGAPVRVLHVLSSTMRAGVEMMVLNLFREMDRERVLFDFVAHDLGEDDLGGEIRRLKRQGLCRPHCSAGAGDGSSFGSSSVIEENGPYAAVRTHTDYQGGVLHDPRRSHDARRICAHLDTRKDALARLLAKKLLGRAFIRNNATRSSARAAGTRASPFLAGARQTKGLGEGRQQRDRPHRVRRM